MGLLDDQLFCTCLPGFPRVVDIVLAESKLLLGQSRAVYELPLLYEAVVCHASAATDAFASVGR